MKISNEVKVGVIALVSITLLVFGINFLKGKRLFSDNKTLHAKFTDVNGLASSNPVVINGLQIGNVAKLVPAKDMRTIDVYLTITKNIDIPTNSIAFINPNLLGTTSVEITLGDAKTLLADKGELATEANSGLFNDILKKVDPVLYEVKNAVTSLDSVLLKFNSILDPAAKNNIASALSNLSRITSSLTVSSANLEILLNTQTGALAKTLNNLESVTSNLSNNNGKITSVLTNLDKTTTNLAELNFKNTLDTLDATIRDLKSLVDNIDQSKGTLGKLLNDPSLYQNLASSSNKLNLLLDDIRVNPKRYVNISLIGRKNTSEPLSIPLPDTVNSPYIIEKVKH